MNALTVEVVDQNNIADLFEASGMSKKRFAAHHGLPYHRVCIWLQPPHSQSPDPRVRLKVHEIHELRELALRLGHPSLSTLETAWRQLHGVERTPRTKTLRGLCLRHGIALAHCAPPVPVPALVSRVGFEDAHAPSTFSAPSPSADLVAELSQADILAQIQDRKRTRYSDSSRALRPEQRYYTDLTNEQWEFIEPLLERPAHEPGVRLHQPRELLNAIFYMLRGGVPWRLLPRDFPKWNTVYKAKRAIEKDGRWDRVLQGLIELDRQRRGKSKQATVGIADTQSVKTGEKGGCADMTPTSGSAGASV